MVTPAADGRRRPNPCDSHRLGLGDDVPNNRGFADRSGPHAATGLRESSISRLGGFPTYGKGQVIIDR